MSKISVAEYKRLAKDPTMNKKPRRGRPPLGFVLIKFFAPQADADYIRAVQKAQSLPTWSDAGRFILSNNRAAGLYLNGNDANIATEPQP